MASMRDIKRRRGSIQSTQQITKAMKLVSTVKLQKAKLHAENAKPYFQHMYQTVFSMLQRSGNIHHPYLQPGESEKKAVIVVTSNRGLAGGYNSNVVKLLTNNEKLKKEEVVLYTLGRKGRDSLERKGYEVKADFSDIVDDLAYDRASQICRQLLEDFANGEIGEIYIAYTVFKNTVSQIPTLTKLLPIEMEEQEAEEETAETAEEETEGKVAPMNYEPKEEDALDIIIPKYVTSIIYGAVTEAIASENGARMQAMDSATSNAEEMIESLSLQYNRARQSSITQELTEIIAGADAIS